MYRQHKSAVSHKYERDAAVQQQQQQQQQELAAGLQPGAESHHAPFGSQAVHPRPPPPPSCSVQDLTLKHGWRTGAIIPELRKEIKIMNTEQYMHMMAWLQALTGLIEQMQVRPVDPLRFTSALLALVTSLQEEFVSDVLC